MVWCNIAFISSILYDALPGIVTVYCVDVIVLGVVNDGIEYVNVTVFAKKYLAQCDNPWAEYTFPDDKFDPGFVNDVP